MSVSGVASYPAYEKHSFLDRLSNGFFFVVEKIKAVLTKVWGGLVALWGKFTGYGNFFVFRFLEWINPNLALRLESFYLRIKEWFQWWNQENIQEKHEFEVDALKRKLKIAEEKGRQVFELNEFLQKLADELKIESSSLKREDGFVSSMMESVLKIQDFFEKRSSDFLTEKESLKENLSRLKGELEEAQNLSQTFKTQLELIQQSLVQAKEKEIYSQKRDLLLEKIYETSLQFQNGGSKSQLDDALERLFPLLLSQLDASSRKIPEIERTLPKDNRGSIFMLGLVRTLSGLKEEFAKMPDLLRMHSDWNTQILKIFEMFQKGGKCQIR